MKIKLHINGWTKIIDADVNPNSNYFEMLAEDLRLPCVMANATISAKNDSIPIYVFKRISETDFEFMEC